VLPQDLVASARVRYMGTSAQKARLVVDLIRGKNVGEAAATLRYTHKAVASEIGRLLDSAVANARQKRQDLDVDHLYVHTAFVDGGPSLKRIQPAPMGRAFRILKRMCHVTIGLGERPAVRAPQAGRAAGAVSAGAAAGAAEGTRKARERKPSGRTKSGSTTRAAKGRRGTRSRKT
jgi:large subunit ribosomal protein L22